MARSPLEVLPVVHAQGGQVVSPDGQQIRSDLRELARSMAREHDALYLVDLDGLHRNKPDVALIQELAKRVPVWADCGSRFASDVMDLMIAGAEQVTVRHATARNEAMLEEIVRLSEHVALGMEFRGQQLHPNTRWDATPPDLVMLAKRFRLPLVVIDLDRAGQSTGIDRSVAWHGRSHPHGAYFAGGVAASRDLEQLDLLGYRGALVSTALIRGSPLSGANWAGPPGFAEQADEGSGVPS